MKTLTSTRPCLLVAVALSAALVVAAALSTGIADAQQKKKSTIRGAGIGALFGQAIGRDTESTLIGGAVGAGVGYMVGNEREKANAAQPAAPVQATPEPLHLSDPAQVLYDALWKLDSVLPKDTIPLSLSKVVIFHREGYVQTLTTNSEGKVTLSEEAFSVAGDTLVVNKPDYVIQARFKVEGDQLVISAQEFSAVLKRLRPE